MYPTLPSPKSVAQFSGENSASARHGGATASTPAHRIAPTPDNALAQMPKASATPQGARYRGGLKTATPPRLVYGAAIPEQSPFGSSEGTSLDQSFDDFEDNDISSGGRMSFGMPPIESVLSDSQTSDSVAPLNLSGGAATPARPSILKINRNLNGAAMTSTSFTGNPATGHANLDHSSRRSILRYARTEPRPNGRPSVSFAKQKEVVVYTTGSRDQSPCGIRHVPLSPVSERNASSLCSSSPLGGRPLDASMMVDSLADDVLNNSTAVSPGGVSDDGTSLFPSLQDLCKMRSNSPGLSPHNSPGYQWRLSIGSEIGGSEGGLEDDANTPSHEGSAAPSFPGLQKAGSVGGADTNELIGLEAELRQAQASEFPTKGVSRQIQQEPLLAPSLGGASAASIRSKVRVGGSEVNEQESHSNNQNSSTKDIEDLQQGAAGVQLQICERTPSRLQQQLLNAGEGGSRGCARRLEPEGVRSGERRLNSAEKNEQRRSEIQADLEPTPPPQQRPGSTPGKKRVYAGSGSGSRKERLTTEEGAASLSGGSQSGSSANRGVSRIESGAPSPFAITSSSSHRKADVGRSPVTRSMAKASGQPLLVDSEMEGINYGEAAEVTGDRSSWPIESVETQETNYDADEALEDDWQPTQLDNNSAAISNYADLPVSGSRGLNALENSQRQQKAFEPFASKEALHESYVEAAGIGSTSGRSSVQDTPNFASMSPKDELDLCGEVVTVVKGGRWSRENAEDSIGVEAAKSLASSQQSESGRVGQLSRKRAHSAGVSPMRKQHSSSTTEGDSSVSSQQQSQQGSGRRSVSATALSKKNGTPLRFRPAEVSPGITERVYGGGDMIWNNEEGESSGFPSFVPPRFSLFGSPSSTSALLVNKSRRDSSFVPMNKMGEGISENIVLMNNESDGYTLDTENNEGMVQRLQQGGNITGGTTTTIKGVVIPRIALDDLSGRRSSNRGKGHAMALRPSETIGSQPQQQVQQSTNDRESSSDGEFSDEDAGDGIVVNVETESYREDMNNNQDENMAVNVREDNNKVSSEQQQLSRVVSSYSKVSLPTDRDISRGGRGTISRSSSDKSSSQCSPASFHKINAKPKGRTSSLSTLPRGDLLLSGLPPPSSASDHSLVIGGVAAPPQGLLTYRTPRIVSTSSSTAAGGGKEEYQTSDYSQDSRVRQAKLSGIKEGAALQSYKECALKDDYPEMISPRSSSSSSVSSQSSQSSSGFDLVSSSSSVAALRSGGDQNNRHGIIVCSEDDGDNETRLAMNQDGEDVMRFDIPNPTSVIDDDDINDNTHKWSAMKPMSKSIVSDGGGDNDEVAAEDIKGSSRGSRSLPASKRHPAVPKIAGLLSSVARDAEVSSKARSLGVNAPSSVMQTSQPLSSSSQPAILPTGGGSNSNSTIFTPRTAAARRTIGPIKLSYKGIVEHLEDGTEKLTPRPAFFDPSEVKLGKAPLQQEGLARPPELASIGGSVEGGDDSRQESTQQQQARMSTLMEDDNENDYDCYDDREATNSEDDGDGSKRHQRQAAATGKREVVSGGPLDSRRSNLTGSSRGGHRNSRASQSLRSSQGDGDGIAPVPAGRVEDVSSTPATSANLEAAMQLHRIPSDYATSQRLTSKSSGRESSVSEFGRTGSTTTAPNGTNKGTDRRSSNLRDGRQQRRLTIEQQRQYRQSNCSSDGPLPRISLHGPGDTPARSEYEYEFESELRRLEREGSSLLSSTSMMTHGDGDYFDGRDEGKVEYGDGEMSDDDDGIENDANVEDRGGVEDGLVLRRRQTISEGRIERRGMSPLPSRSLPSQRSHSVGADDDMMGRVKGRADSVAPSEGRDSLETSSPGGDVSVSAASPLLQSVTRKATTAKRSTVTAAVSPSLHRVDRSESGGRKSLLLKRQSPKRTQRRRSRVTSGGRGVGEISRQRAAGLGGRPLSFDDARGNKDDQDNPFVMSPGREFSSENDTDNDNEVAKNSSGVKVEAAEARMRSEGNMADVDMKGPMHSVDVRQGEQDDDNGDDDDPQVLFEFLKAKFMGRLSISGINDQTEREESGGGLEVAEEYGGDAKRGAAGVKGDSSNESLRKGCRSSVLGEAVSEDMLRRSVLAVCGEEARHRRQMKSQGSCVRTAAKVNEAAGQPHEGLEAADGADSRVERSDGVYDSDMMGDLQTVEEKLGVDIRLLIRKARASIRRSSIESLLDKVPNERDVKAGSSSLVSGEQTRQAKGAVTFGRRSDNKTLVKQTRKAVVKTPTRDLVGDDTALKRRGSVASQARPMTVARQRASRISEGGESSVGTPEAPQSALVRFADRPPTVRLPAEGFSFDEFQSECGIRFLDICKQSEGRSSADDIYSSGRLDLSSYSDRAAIAAAAGGGDEGSSSSIDATSVAQAILSDVPISWEALIPTVACLDTLEAPTLCRAGGSSSVAESSAGSLLLATILHSLDNNNFSERGTQEEGGPDDAAVVPPEDPTAVEKGAVAVDNAKESKPSDTGSGSPPSTALQKSSGDITPRLDSLSRVLLESAQIAVWSSVIDNLDLDWPVTRKRLSLLVRQFPRSIISRHVLKWVTGIRSGSKEDHKKMVLLRKRLVKRKNQLFVHSLASWKRTVGIPAKRAVGELLGQFADQIEMYRASVVKETLEIEEECNRRLKGGTETTAPLNGGSGGTTGNATALAKTSELLHEKQLVVAQIEESLAFDEGRLRRAEERLSSRVEFRDKLKRAYEKKELEGTALKWAVVDELYRLRLRQILIQAVTCQHDELDLIQRFYRFRLTAVSLHSIEVAVDSLGLSDWAGADGDLNESDDMRLHSDSEDDCKVTARVCSLQPTVALLRGTREVDIGRLSPVTRSSRLMLSASRLGSTAERTRKSLKPLSASRSTRRSVMRQMRSFESELIKGITPNDLHSLLGDYAAGPEGCAESHSRRAECMETPAAGKKKAFDESYSATSGGIALIANLRDFLKAPADCDTTWPLEDLCRLNRIQHTRGSGMGERFDELNHPFETWLRCRSDVMELNLRETRLEDMTASRHPVNMLFGAAWKPPNPVASVVWRYEIDEPHQMESLAAEKLTGSDRETPGTAVANESSLSTGDVNDENRKPDMASEGVERVVADLKSKERTARLLMSPPAERPTKVLVDGLAVTLRSNIKSSLHFYLPLALGPQYQHRVSTNSNSSLKQIEDISRRAEWCALEAVQGPPSAVAQMELARVHAANRQKMEESGKCDGDEFSHNHSFRCGGFPILGEQGRRCQMMTSLKCPVGFVHVATDWDVRRRLFAFAQSKLAAAAQGACELLELPRISPLDESRQITSPSMCVEAEDGSRKNGVGDLTMADRRKSLIQLSQSPLPASSTEASLQEKEQQGSPSMNETYQPAVPRDAILKLTTTALTACRTIEFLMLQLRMLLLCRFPFCATGAEATYCPKGTMLPQLSPIESRPDVASEEISTGKLSQQGRVLADDELLIHVLLRRSPDAVESAGDGEEKEGGSSDGDVGGRDTPKVVRSSKGAIKEPLKSRLPDEGIVLLVCSVDVSLATGSFIRGVRLSCSGAWLNTFYWDLPSDKWEHHRIALEMGTALRHAVEEFRDVNRPPELNDLVDVINAAAEAGSFC